MGPICVAAAIQDEKVLLRVLLKEIKLMDYFKKETEKVSL